MTFKQKLLFYLRLFGICAFAAGVISVLFWLPVYMVLRRTLEAHAVSMRVIATYAGLEVLFVTMLLAVIIAVLAIVIFKPLGTMIGKMNTLLLDKSVHNGTCAKQKKTTEKYVNELLRFFSDNQQQMQMLFSISRILMSSIDFDELVSSVLATISRYFDDSYCCMINMDTDGYLKVRSNHGFSVDSMRVIRYRPGEGIIGKAYTTLKPVIINNTAQEGDGLTGLMRQRDKIESLLFIPLNVENQTIGLLGFGSRRLFYFTPQRISSITTVADYLAVSLRNIRMYEQLQSFNRRLESEVSSTTQELTHTNTRLIKKVRELKVLYDILMAISTKLDINEVMNAMMDKIPDLIDAELFHFLLADRPSRSFVSSHLMIGQKMIPTNGLIVRYDEKNILFNVFESGKPLLSNEMGSSGSHELGIPSSYSVKSMICLPVRTQFETVGIFCVGNKVGGNFNQDDVRVLHLLMSQLGEVIDNISLYHEKEKRVADLSMLQRISTTISSSPVLSITLKNITHIIAESLRIDYCVFLLYDEAVGELVTQVGFQDQADAEMKHARIYVNDQYSRSARVFREGKPFCSSSLHDLPDGQEIITEENVSTNGSLIILPLKVENQIIGVLRLGSKQKDYFNSDHLRLANLIADQSAIIIENAKLYQRIRDAVHELEQLNKMKNEFIAVISHELRTPITTISGFVNILLKEEAGKLNTKQRRFLEISEQSVKRLIEILNDILDVSRIEAGRIALHLTSSTIADLLKETVKRFRRQCKLHKIKVELNIPQPLPQVFVDQNRMLEVFKHMMQNCIKFTNSSGSITIQAFDRGDFIQIEFKDTGIGIAQENYEKIFDKFFQVDMTPARRQGGTGLGLSIVRSIVELHGGKIWVESELGKGSVFKIILPKSRMKERAHAEKDTHRR
ncbi:MAG: GAF domain-containing protein [Elusimicrobia bacterium]|nr:GAF domain-containing protein [Elusimicrobiota bacterium]MBD3412441.1 GAF domain-containing protein [Elusimicrobiota bacterium]